jgi:hypothetical protein
MDVLMSVRRGGNALVHKRAPPLQHSMDRITIHPQVVLNP